MSNNNAIGVPIRRAVTRRRVVAAAAWTVPVVTVSAPLPAYAAASQCTPTTSFDNLTPGSRPRTLTFEPSNVVATLSYSEGGSGRLGLGDTSVVSRTRTSPAWNYLTLEMVPGRDRLTSGHWVQLTITLSEPITGLSFIVHDIDSTSGGYLDTVQVLTEGYDYELGSNIRGTGTDTNRFRPITTGDTPIDSGRGDVRLTWSTAVSEVSIRYVAGITGSSSNQHIGLGDLSYDACLELPQRTTRARSVPAVRRPIAVSRDTPVLDDHRESGDR